MNSPTITLWKSVLYQCLGFLKMSSITLQHENAGEKAYFLWVTFLCHLVPYKIYMSMTLNI